MDQTRTAHTLIFDCTCGKSFSGTPKQVTALRKAHTKICKFAQVAGEPIHTGRIDTKHPKTDAAHIKETMKGRAEFKEHVTKLRNNTLLSNSRVETNTVQDNED